MPVPGRSQKSCLSVGWLVTAVHSRACLRGAIEGWNTAKQTSWLLFLAHLVLVGLSCSESPRFFWQGSCLCRTGWQSILLFLCAAVGCSRHTTALMEYAKKDNPLPRKTDPKCWRTLEDNGTGCKLMYLNRFIINGKIKIIFVKTRVFQRSNPLFFMISNRSSVLLLLTHHRVFAYNGEIGISGYVEIFDVVLWFDCKGYMLCMAWRITGFCSNTTDYRGCSTLPYKGSCHLNCFIFTANILLQVMAKIIPCLSLRQLSLRAAEDGIINNHPFPSIVPECPPFTKESQSL